MNTFPEFRTARWFRKGGWFLLFFCLFATLSRADESEEKMWKKYDRARRTPLPISNQRLRIPSQKKATFLPYFVSYGSATRSANPKTAVLGIHGGARNAKRTLQILSRVLRRTSGSKNDILILAPHYVYSWNLTAKQRKENVLYWDGEWMAGGTARNAPDIDSFETINYLLQQLLFIFPTIKNITFVGHSAGAQFIHRYAFLGQAEKEWPTIRFRYVAANPSSYLWLEENKTPQCPEAFSYKYGLGEIPSQLLGKNSVSLLLRQFAAKNVYYILARGDKRQDPFLDTSCEAKTQGEHRLARGENYKKMLEHVYGEGVHQTHRFIYLPSDTDHDMEEVFLSTEVRELLFGK